MAKKQAKKAPPTIAAQLRAAVADSGLSQYRIAKETGISQPIITRFVNGDRDMSLENAGKLADFLGLHLVKRKV